VRLVPDAARLVSAPFRRRVARDMLPAQPADRSGGAMLRRTSPRGGRTGRPARLRLVLAVIVAACLVALTAACGNSHPQAGGGGFVGYWQLTGGSGGVRIDKLGEDYYLSIVSGSGSVGAPKRASLQNGSLYSGQSGTAASPGTGPGAWFLISGDPGSGKLTMTIGILAGAQQQFKLERSTSTATPSPNPFISPSGYSPPPTPQALVNGSLSSAKDKQVAENLYAIQTAVEKYIAYQHTVPDASEVTLVGVVSSFLDPWPANPYTSAGGPMIVARRPGDYEYAKHGNTYTLTAYLGNGSTFVISGPPR
jgi:hypothetical protein